jgi:hypothetical protein
VGVPAAKEAAAAAAERIQAGKEKEEMHVEFEALDRAVQLEAISAGDAPAESEPIMGPTPRFMSELTGHASIVPDAPELSYGPDGSQRTGGENPTRGRVRPLGSANLSAELLRLDEQTKSGREAKRKSGAAMSVSIGTDLRKEIGDEVKQEPGAKNKLALESDLIASIVGGSGDKKSSMDADGDRDLKRPRYNCGGITKWADQVYKDYGPPDICGLFKAGGNDVAEGTHGRGKGYGRNVRRRCQGSAGEHAQIAEKITEALDEAAGSQAVARVMYIARGVNATRGRSHSPAQHVVLIRVTLKRLISSNFLH